MVLEAKAEVVSVADRSKLTFCWSGDSRQNRTGEIYTRALFLWAIKVINDETNTYEPYLSDSQT